MRCLLFSLSLVMFLTVYSAEAGYFKIKSKWNDKYLGVDSKDNMVLHDEDDILWKWVGSTLVNKKNQQFLDIPGADTSNGAEVMTWLYSHGGRHQQWTTEGHNHENIVSKLNGKVLDIFQPTAMSVGMWMKNDMEWQKWEWELLAGTIYFKIRSKWDGSYIGVNSERNLFLTTWEWEWDANTLVNKKNRKVLDIAGGSTNNGAEVVTWWNSHGGNHQQWKIEDDYIVSLMNGKVVDITQNNVNMVLMWTKNNMKWQKWEIESSPTYNQEQYQTLSAFTQDGSLGFIPGNVSALIALASTFPDTIEVTCCCTRTGNPYKKTCGNGESCTDICGPNTSDCMAFTTSDEDAEKRCMEGEDWCDEQSDTQGKKKKRAARWMTVQIWKISFCTRKVTRAAQISVHPVCCLHPFTRRKVAGVKRKCCSDHKLCN